MYAVHGALWVVAGALAGLALRPVVDWLERRGRR